MGKKDVACGTKRREAIFSRPFGRFCVVVCAGLGLLEPVRWMNFHLTTEHWRYCYYN